MSLLLNSSLVKCIQRILPAIRHKNISFKNIYQPKNIIKADHSKLTSIKCLPLPKHSATVKSVVFGFSLLGLFGLDDEVDSELKLINTIKQGLLYLQVRRRFTKIVACKIFTNIKFIDTVYSDYTKYIYSLFLRINEI